VSIAGEEADLSWPDWRLIVEIDGDQFHHDKVEDARRTATWTAAGWTVRRASGDLVFTDAPGFIAALRGYLEDAGRPLEDGRSQSVHRYGPQAHTTDESPQPPTNPSIVRAPRPTRRTNRLPELPLVTEAPRARSRRAARVSPRHRRPNHPSSPRRLTPPLPAAHTTPPGRRPSP
jgi:hypothetical protein